MASEQNAYPLDLDHLRTLVDRGVLSDVVLLDDVDSTNAWVKSNYQADTMAHATLVTCEHQTAGRGRHDRTWVVPRGAALTSSLFLSPRGVALAHWPWLTMMMGLAVTSCLRETYSLDAGLKWPNDVLLSGTGKISGVLAEVVSTSAESPGVVVGCGVNVHQRADQIPDGGMSMRTAGVPGADRSEVLGQILTRFFVLYDEWVAASGNAEESGLAAAVRKHCITLGQPIDVQLPGDESTRGMAVSVTDDGSLAVEPTTGPMMVVSAADVTHIRPTPRP